MTLSEIRNSSLPEADKKMYFYDRMLSLMCLKRHNMDRYSEILPHYLYWKIQANGGSSDPSNRLRPESIEYCALVVASRYLRLRVTDLVALEAKEHDKVS